MPLSPSTEPFELLESLLYRPGEGYWLREAHLDRLERSARHFGYRCARAEVEAALASEAASHSAPRKVRLLLDSAGRARTEAEAVRPSPDPVTVVLARAPVDPADPFLYHKTTRRAVYDRAFASRGVADDVLLWNTAGELTEASSSNLVIALDSVLVTPPVESGLLAGTFREALLRQGEVQERVVRREDLDRAGSLFLINSVRGWRAAVYKPRRN